jgi:hypothetical protein
MEDGMEFSRRYFFFGSVLAGAVPSAGFGSTPSLKAAGYKSPNEKLNFAAIGSGGQGASNLGAAAPTENVVALCDTDELRAAPTFKRFPDAPKFRDFRQMLDKEGKNIDAVIVATPDHMHATAAVWAMERGKHVYVQKPLVRTIWEARQLREAAAKYKVATQMGNQGYSNWASPISGRSRRAARRSPISGAGTSTSRSTGAGSMTSAAARWATWRATSSGRRTWRCTFPSARSSGWSA